MGGGASRARRDEPQAAELVFHIVYFERIRGAPPIVPQRFARLPGELWLEGMGRTPIFRPTAPAGEPVEVLHDDPTDSAGQRRGRRGIDLIVSASNFRRAPDAAPLRLWLPPPDDERARYAEIHTSLEVGGAAEAPLGSNDVLDVVLAPLRDGPVFEWPDGSSAELPDDLTLTLRQGGRSMSLRWTAGTISGAFRRFEFSRLQEDAPYTLIATAAGRKVVLLEDQKLDDPNEPIRWRHWLEELAVASAVDRGEIPFGPVSGPPHGQR